MILKQAIGTFAFTFAMLIVGTSLSSSNQLYAQKQSIQPSSAFTPKIFSRYWKIESESTQYKMHFLHDTLEVIAPQGLTLWYKEKLKGDVVIEYDACIVKENANDRLSDLNCFWMMSDPNNQNIWTKEKWRNGNFNKYYSLQGYYMGYGGNNNSTTRFRRYNGDYKTFETKQKRPEILTEYTDSKHLLKANKWYHIRLEAISGKVTYTIDGERLIDYRDPENFQEGWFGFRTTQARFRFANFNIQQIGDSKNVSLKWIGNAPDRNANVSFGVPFRKGEVTGNQSFTLYNTNGILIPTQQWEMARWPDGSIKWAGFSAVIPGNTQEVTLKKESSKSPTKTNSIITIKDKGTQFTVSTGNLTAYFSTQGNCFLDSIYSSTKKIANEGILVASTESRSEERNGVISTLQTPFKSKIKSTKIEYSGTIRTVVRIDGVYANNQREWLPFTIRLYFFAGSNQIKMVHSFIYDGEANKDFIRSIGIRFKMPLREALYNRHVSFAGEGEGFWSEPVQPLTGRRVLQLGNNKTLYQAQIEGKRIPEYSAFDSTNQDLINHWASWDSYRLSQLSADAFSIRKRTGTDCPWIGTFSANRSRGFAFAGDVSGGIALSLHDFWQSFPASIEINGMRSKEAEITAWLWSPESEAMDLRHYDKVAHDLNASYEDVQEGLSTPYGIARTNTLMLQFTDSLPSLKEQNTLANQFSNSPQLICSPEYLHSCHAFGQWSLPDRSTPERALIEKYLDDLTLYYEHSIAEQKWYGFWNYGDVMHTYDAERHCWRYDVGGYAWDNTELASNMFLWYTFLRSGKESIWKMAEAMTRHTSEVDVYHLGDLAGLGSRHNVSHWGCGAKEARISQAAWNRFYYYLTTDERCGDLMEQVTDADQKLYTLDPMRLAQPRSEYPCSAPARLRVGPDWLAYAGNWMTHWERTGDKKYYNKIKTGMTTIGQLPQGLFSSPIALGYDPATGIVTHEGDTSAISTNHLMTIMGGFEVGLEMMEMIQQPDWERAWLDHAARYAKVGGKHFLVPKLTAYAASKLRSKGLAKQAWKELLSTENIHQLKLDVHTVNPPYVLYPINESFISTNDAATWALNAIYMMEVIPLDKSLLEK
ncbi:MAG: hypothetical protein KBH23_02860 [Bacteroidaceae bacterium]|nr:hypothetical protein [Bacteroidaceae bacterium]